MAKDHRFRFRMLDYKKLPFNWIDGFMEIDAKYCKHPVNFRIIVVPVNVDRIYDQPVGFNLDLEGSTYLGGQSYFPFYDGKPKLKLIIDEMFRKAKPIINRFTRKELLTTNERTVYVSNSNGINLRERFMLKGNGEYEKVETRQRVYGKRMIKAGRDRPSDKFLSED